MTALLLQSSIVLVLLAIAAQDFKYRAVSWYLFPVLIAFLCAYVYPFDVIDIVINIGFILLVFALLTLWFSLLHGRPLNLFKEHLGLGDVLFLLCLSVYFTPANFFLFYLCSLILICIGTGFYFLIRKAEQFTVPLAGLQGMILMILMAGGWMFGLEIGHIDFTKYLL